MWVEPSDRLRQRLCGRNAKFRGSRCGGHLSPAPIGTAGRKERQKMNFAQTYFQRAEQNEPVLFYIVIETDGYAAALELQIQMQHEQINCCVSRCSVSASNLCSTA